MYTGRNHRRRCRPSLTPPLWSTGRHHASGNESSRHQIWYPIGCGNWDRARLGIEIRGEESSLCWICFLLCVSRPLPAKSVNSARSMEAQGALFAKPRACTRRLPRSYRERRYSNSISLNEGDDKISLAPGRCQCTSQVSDEWSFHARSSLRITCIKQTEMAFTSSS